MSGYATKAFMLACALLSMGCADGPIEHVTSPTIEPPKPDVASSLTLSSHELSLEEGDQTLLSAVVQNQWRHTMYVTARINYTTTAPAIATVESDGSGGFVQAVSPGTAIIRASVTVGQATLVDSTIIVVNRPDFQSHLLFAALTDGWSPPIGRLVSGGTIEWQGGFIASSGVPVQTVSLWKTGTDRPIVDEIDMASGRAERTLTEPGIYNFCSNACWDNNEWGVIVVK